MDEAIRTTIDLTIQDYLKGCVGYELDDAALTSIFFNRGIEWDAIVWQLDKNILDLCRADVYMWCATKPSVSSTVEDADGGWKHREGGSQMTYADRKHLISMANSIYNEYGVSKRNSGIKLINL